MPRKKKVEAPQAEELVKEEESVKELEIAVEPEVSTKVEKPKQAIEFSDEAFIHWYNNLSAGEAFTVKDVALLFDTPEERIRETIAHVKGKRLPEDLGHIVS